MTIATDAFPRRDPAEFSRWTICLLIVHCPALRGVPADHPAPGSVPAGWPAACGGDHRSPAGPAGRPSPSRRHPPSRSHRNPSSLCRPSLSRLPSPSRCCRRSSPAPRRILRWSCHAPKPSKPKPKSETGRAPARAAIVHPGPGCPSACCSGSARPPAPRPPACAPHGRHNSFHGSNDTSATHGWRRSSGNKVWLASASRSTVRAGCSLFGSTGVPATLCSMRRCWS